MSSRRGLFIDEQLIPAPFPPVDRVALFLNYCVGAVVGALADRVNHISRRVCVPDCGDLPVLQSSDLSLSADG